MKRILILSNNCISNTESNGRTHGSLFNYYKNKRYLHNFYISGIPDVADVNYVSFSMKKCLISRISFGLFKSSPNSFSNNCVSASIKKRGKNILSKIPLFHLLRNFLLNSRTNRNILLDYVKDNRIELIQIWGSNVPCLYKFGVFLSKKANIPLTILTGEDYPIKKYNFINKFSLIFPFFRKKLYREAKMAYSLSEVNFFNSEDLKRAYENEFYIKKTVLFTFPSILNADDFINIKGNNILYAGNLYSGRCDSLLEIADMLKPRNINIDVYGNVDLRNLKKLVERKNVIYHGLVSYNCVLDAMRKAEILLHIEGFSPEYINDCKYAFSSKLSDCFCSGKKVFIYGPLEISGVKFVHSLDCRIVASNKFELDKLINVIEKEIVLNPELVAKNFGSIEMNNRIKNALEVI